MNTNADSQFSSLPIRPELLQSLSGVNYVEMTPIQERSASPIIEGRDLLAQAETGSGKTAAFAIGILNKLDASVFQTQALVICPTRELSDQVAEEIRRLASSLANVRVLTLCGGRPIHDQLASLKRAPHIVVGTPGRLKKLVEKGSVAVNKIETLVLDEADRMLDMGFNDDIMAIIGKTSNKRQTLLFSATYPDEIVAVSSVIQNDPVEVRVAASNTVENIKQVFVLATDEQKPEMLLRAVGKYQLENAIVFCNRKNRVQSICDSLKAQGVKARPLHGDLEQRDRDEAIILFGNKSISYLVATDVAARGLDIDDLSAVISYDLTPDSETHLHRTGRTGRAGKQGIAITFVNQDELHRLEAIEGQLGEVISFEKLLESDVDHGMRSNPATRTIQISAGKKDKIRAGDIVGALTADSELTNDHIGKITVQAKISFVAVDYAKAPGALKTLTEGRIKRQKVRARLIS